LPADFAFSPDRIQQFFYVVDSGLMRVVIFNRAPHGGRLGNKSLSVEMVNIGVRRSLSAATP
jgi:hypothetical protein